LELLIGAALLTVSTTAIRVVQTVQDPHMGVREENSGIYLSVARELASQQMHSHNACSIFFIQRKQL
jgi:hypothetical protein